MEPGNGELPQADQATPIQSIRNRISSWLTFAALMVFFIVTVAIWGYAAWWSMAKLIGLIV